MPPLQLRRNTSTYWQQANPTPASGEPVAFTDSGQLAVGDGTTPLISLPRMLTDKLAAALYVGRSLLGIAGGVATLAQDGLLVAGQARAVSVWHGNTPTTPRPATAAGTPVLWTGTTTPSNAVSGDLLALNGSATKGLQQFDGTTWVSLAGMGTSSGNLATYASEADVDAAGAAGQLQNGQIVAVTSL